MKNNNIEEYFYNLNWQLNEDELCNLEMKCLFNQEVKSKFIVSDIYVDPSRSRFIKGAISVLYSSENLEEIVKLIQDNKLAYEKFKVIFVKFDGVEVEYQDRLNAVRKIGMNIVGEAEIHSPEIVFGVTKANGRWMFGVYKQHDVSWHIHDRKPYTYSNALGIALARTLLNMAIKNDMTLKLVDPCCGIGTVIMEAIDLGLDIKGYEINAQIAANAKENLKFFGYENVITTGSMHDIEDHYDAAIVDLPYGLFTKVTRKEQEDIIKTARRIADKAIIITFEDMDKLIEDSGFRIVDKCAISKGKFTRYIHICE